MAVLIHQLLNEGVRSHDVRNCHDQLVEAVVFAKVLSSNDAFPLCRNIYLQLHAAIPFFREAGANTGVALSGIFADGTEFTPVTKLCAYIYGMLFPAHAHDHTFAALYNNAFTEYESQFPGLDVLKPLSQGDGRGKTCSHSIFACQSCRIGRLKDTAGTHEFHPFTGHRTFEATNGQSHDSRCS